MPSAHDDERFAVREIAASPVPIELPRAPDASDAPMQRGRLQAADLQPESFEHLLRSNGTSSFLLVDDGVIVFERYYDGAAPERPRAAFSVTKSFLSALVGIALDRKLFASVEDPIVGYVPELEARGYGPVQLKHLLSMSEGVRYSHASVPWTGAARAYYSPDRWATVLGDARIGTRPGALWNYNDYAPVVLTVALERAAGTDLGALAKEMLLDPLGMAHPARWTVDSEKCRSVNAAAGLYVSPRTLATFGQAHLDNGRVGARQVIPAEWIETATTLTDSDPPLLRSVPTKFFSAERMSYKYLWWIKERPGDGDDFIAIGNLGQFVYCSPSTRTVIVRTGRKWGRFGATNWLELLERIAHPSAGAGNAGAASRLRERSSVA